MLTLGSVVALNQGCGKVVGIEDTKVGDMGGASGDGGTGSGGKGGSAGKGSAGKSSATGGATTGGSAGSGVGGGGSGKGAGGGSAGKGGSDVGGEAGSPGTGGSSGGKGGSAGSGGKAGATGGTGDEGGMGGTPDPCGGLTERCVSTGHEICESGAWKSDPCPLDKPTCEDDTCIVRGPTMVQVGEYWIDSTEVTVEQYQAFLTAKNGDTSGQIGLCGWNDDYTPNGNPGAANLPISYVDWCDADAFCKWADKHLCGRIDGGQIAYEELLIANDSQWYRACGGPNNGTHPNGNPTCNSNGGFEDTAPVATFPDCEGYYPGLFDMEGNVAEWVDLCEGNAGAADHCYLLGGNIIDSQSYCTEIYESYTRDTTAYTFGFRCCSG